MRKSQGLEALAIAVTFRLEKYSSSAGCGSGLVDLLVAGGRVLGAHVDVGADLVELEVVRQGEELDEIELVLGVTGGAPPWMPAHWLELSVGHPQPGS
jgi:hypothetical protein